MREALRLAAPSRANAGQCLAENEVRLSGHCVPAMVAPYVGAVKDYVAAPLFMLFGIHVFLARMSAALFGVIGVIGFAIFIRDQVGVIAGSASALVLAVHPAYLDQVLFDNGNIAVSMGFIGLAALVGNAWCQSKKDGWRLVLGVICGAAVWGRLNFVWILFAVVVGMGVAFGWRSLVRVRAWLLWTTAFVFGSAPLLIYHFQNPSALQSFMSSHGAYHNGPEFWEYVVYRLRIFSEILFSDGEHRAIWTRTIVDWGNSFLWVIVLGAGIWCMLRRSTKSFADRWVRCIGSISVVLFVVCLTSQLPIAEHHLVMLIPFLSVCLVVVLHDVLKLGRAGRIFAWSVGIGYFAAALGLDAAAAIAIHRTGGLGMWSDAIDSVNRQLGSNPGAGDLKILDWGLQANLFFLSKATVSGEELFWGADEDRSARHLTWREEVSKGGQFLTSATRDRVFPAATGGFEKALKESGAQFRLRVFSQKDGEPYAILYQVESSQSVDLTPEAVKHAD